MKPEEFRIRAYSKQELAQAYFPMANPHVAVNRLMRWIQTCEELKKALQQIGYKKTSKFFTPKEVGLIVDYLGEP